jgi:GDPmannose 4,6-dehydratase
MMQQKNGNDLVIASGLHYSVKDFINEAARFADFDLNWVGSGLNEYAQDLKSGKIIVRVDQGYFRPLEVDYLVGDASKAKELIGWQPKITFEKLVEEMMEVDFQLAKIENEFPGVHRV